MLNINPKFYEGREFIKADPNIHYTCIGVGQAPDSGANYALGVHYDAPNNRSEVKTFLFREITFIGDLTAIVPTAVAV
jgi:hypothetical protein